MRAPRLRYDPTKLNLSSRREPSEGYKRVQPRASRIRRRSAPLREVKSDSPGEHTGQDARHRHEAGLVFRDGRVHECHPPRKRASLLAPIRANLPPRQPPPQRRRLRGHLRPGIERARDDTRVSCTYRSIMRVGDESVGAICALRGDDVAIRRDLSGRRESPRRHLPERARPPPAKVITCDVSLHPDVERRDTPRLSLASDGLQCLGLE